MKEESEAGTRKSNRQRVPNAFYTEGINELKKNTRALREPAKQVRKRSKVFQQDDDNSYADDLMEEEKSEQLNENSGWYECRLPKDGSLIKVQFVLNQPERTPPPVVQKVQKKRQQPAKIVKKADSSSFDLLSLFQKAIENVNVEVDNQRPADSEPTIKEVSKKIQAPAIKQRKVEDSEGRILQVLCQGDRTVFRHSKLGEVQYAANKREETSGESPISREKVQYLRGKVQELTCLSQISIFT